MAMCQSMWNGWVLVAKTYPSGRIFLYDCQEIMINEPMVSFVLATDKWSQEMNLRPTIPCVTYSRSNIRNIRIVMPNYDSATITLGSEMTEALGGPRNDDYSCLKNDEE